MEDPGSETAAGLLDAYMCMCMVWICLLQHCQLFRADRWLVWCWQAAFLNPVLQRHVPTGACAIMLMLTGVIPVTICCGSTHSNTSCWTPAATPDSSKACTQ
jgi:hypothetical protein